MTNLKLLLKLTAILTIALGLKYHYSTASVNELKWVLAPTTFLVEMITGTLFTFESNAGYMSDDQTFLIARSCAGVNFLIIAFLLLTIRPLLREHELNTTWLSVALVISYLVTLVANTARIVVAIELQRSDLSIFGLSDGTIHRLEGIVVYFIFLMILFCVSEKRWAGALLGSTRLRSGLGCLVAIYYAVTLGIPLLRGSYNEYASFWVHSIYVAIVPLVIVVPVMVLSFVKNRFWSPQ